MMCHQTAVRSTSKYDEYLGDDEVAVGSGLRQAAVRSMRVGLLTLFVVAYTTTNN